jgi:hypothetical protein
LLLDLIGRDSTEQWREWSRTLLVTYAQRPVLAALKQRLCMPKGLELVLWKSRTNYLPASILAQRIEELKQILSSIGI